MHKTNQTHTGRRNFLKVSSLAGGGMIIGFNWITACDPLTEPQTSEPEIWNTFNAYLKIGKNGNITIMAPNPEGGQNVKTSMPMIVADELDANWNDVRVEQAALNVDLYDRQYIGGSQGIRRAWQSLRNAGATARQMLMETAAEAWDVPVSELETKSGKLIHKVSGKSAGYGEFASDAAKRPVPENVKLKTIGEFNIIGTSRKNVENLNIVTGKPLFGIDTQQEGMLIAMIIHPPAFGQKLKSFDDKEVLDMPGIRSVFAIDTYSDDFERQYFDTNTFTRLVAIVGESTWQVMKAKKAIKIEWEPIEEHSFKRNAFGNLHAVTVPPGLENTSGHREAMKTAATSSAVVVRKDGDPEKAFQNASQVIERTYSAPFLAHNCMEPMNFFAHVTPEKVTLKGPLQKPELTEKTISERLGIPLDRIDIEMTRLGGGFGRRSYAHWLVEAALISQKVEAPVKLVYSREDDMTSGIYRPAYQATYRAALDAENNLIGFHVNAGGIPESPLYANRFPAGAVENYLAEDWTVNSNITVGSFRAPRSNFIAGAEQSFLDEVAEAAGKDPIDFRIELLQKAKENPVGESNDYDAERYAGVLQLVREKSGWGETVNDQFHRGVSAYFSHNTYVAEVLDMKIENNRPVIKQVHCAVDCGIVVNPDAAKNLAEGCIVDGIGNAMFGGLSFNDGKAEQKNFDQYRLIRHREAPQSIQVYFVENEHDPTGMGEPPFPPVFGALANAMFKATGKRHYHQPFMAEWSS